MSAFWQTAYGSMPMVKIGLRIRPRTFRANPHVPADGERRHWLPVRSEPVLAVGVVAAVALLIAFSLPPRQRGDANEAARAATPACDPCALPAPARDELAVAEAAGSQLVAAWIRREGTGVTGTVRVLDYRGRPARVPFRVRDAKQEACGRGCRRFSASGEATALRIAVTERGRRYVAELPTRWRRGEDARARRLLGRAQAVMRRLRSVREVEDLTSGPGSYARTDYRLRAPGRVAYATNGGVRSVIIDERQWFRAPGTPWEAREYGAGLPFRTRSWFRWTIYARAVRLLDLRHERGRPVAELALMDPVTPVWFRLIVDRRTRRITRVRMIAKAHYMTQHYYAFNQPMTIRAPIDES